jgi:hypothetical protein
MLKLQAYAFCGVWGSKRTGDVVTDCRARHENALGILVNR